MNIAVPVEERETSELLHDIDETRAALSAKLEILEGEVRGTVGEAKEVVEEKVESVKRFFSLQPKIQEYPLSSVGVSVAAGVLLGALIDRGNRTLARMEETPPDLGRREALFRQSASPALGLVALLWGASRGMLGTMMWRAVRDAWSGLQTNNSDSAPAGFKQY